MADPAIPRTNADFAKLFQRQIRATDETTSAASQRESKDEQDEVSSTRVSFSQSASFARAFGQQTFVSQREQEDSNPVEEATATATATATAKAQEQQQEQTKPALTKQEKQRLQQLGKWEKHTKGFGKKMLEKMGFKGRLGRNEQGISSTLEVVQRPNQMGIGFGDFREASALKHNQKLQRELRGEQVDEDNDRAGAKRPLEATAVVEDDTLWRKRKVPTGFQKKKYKKASEIAQSVGQTATGTRTSKRSEVVLDMRGPDVRVLQNVSAAYDVQYDQSERVTVSKPKLGEELIYNVHMVVNLAQGRVYDLSQKLASNKTTMANMHQEIDLFNGQIEVQTTQVDHLEQLVQQLSKLESRLQDDPAIQTHGINDLVVQLSELRDRFAVEFDRYKVVHLLPTLMIPVIKDFLSCRDLGIAEEVDEMVAQFRNLQLFLLQLTDPVHEKEAQAYNQGANKTPSPGLPGLGFGTTRFPPASSSSSSSSAFSGGQVFAFDDPLQAQKDMETLYNYILEETLWPMMTHFINARWRVTSQVNECIEMIEKFRPHLSGAFERALLQRLVFARLQLTCQQSSSQPEHAKWALSLDIWLFPWLPVLGEESFSRLYPDIRLCVSSALNNWHPSDTSVVQAVHVLSRVWSPREFAQFTNRQVIPKLVRCLKRDFTVNPQSQSLDPLMWVLAWQQVLPKRQFVALFEGEFFPKWLEVLRKWICGTPNLKELITWYCGWKQFFSKQQLAEEARLLVCFHGALVLLEAAAKAALQPEKQPAADRQVVIPHLNPAAPRNYQEALMQAKAQSDDQSESDKSLPPSRSSSPARATKPSTFSSAQVSLKDVVEELAVANDLVFLPKGTHDGQQVYLFGKKHILIDKGVVFVEETKGNYRPVDVEQLL